MIARKVFRLSVDLLSDLANGASYRFALTGKRAFQDAKLGLVHIAHHANVVLHERLDARAR